MRVFIGIGLTPECRRAIVQAIFPLRAKRPPVSWTPEQNLHITLKFLGEIPRERVPEIAASMESVAGRMGAFEFSVESPGGFPSLRAPRILWVGIREPLELVGKLQENIENVLSSAGFPREGRPFHPHITVGRVRDRLPLGWGEEYAKALSGKTFGVVGARSMLIYESRLSPGGAEYGILREVPLSGMPVIRVREEKEK